jgi:hypothetical protein
MPSLIRLVTGAVGGVGVAIATGAGFLVVRGPFLGGELLAPKWLLVALGAFVVGVTVAAWGVTRTVRLRS